MKTVMMGAVLALMATGAAAQAAPRVVEQAQVPAGRGSERTVALLKSGRNLETITCRDYVGLADSYRPTAVRYAANYGPKGRAHPTMTVAGIERVTPEVTQACRTRPGDHFVTAVHNAMMKNPA